MALYFVCPQCHKPVEPIGSNAIMTPGTKQWQHANCRSGKERRGFINRRKTPDRRKNAPAGEFAETT